MNRRLSCLVAFASLILLAGCTVSRGTPFDPDTEPVSASVNDESALRTATLAPSESIWYEVSVSSTVADNGALLYLETEAFSGPAGSLELRLSSNTGTPLATSTSAAGFGAGAESLSAAASSFEPLILVTRVCRGPCIIVDSQTGTALIRVRNTGNSSVTFGLYAFTTEHGDGNEDANDNISTAPSFGAGSFEQGAVETLFDDDYYRVSSNGTLNFSTQSTAGLVADVRLNERVLQQVQPGGSYPVEAGDLVHVYSTSDSAGPPSEEGTLYTLDIQ